ncbi:MAG: GFA family protein, partial [Methylobacterium sp.]
MADDATIRSGRCHCGAVRFEAALGDDLASIRR